MLDFDKRRAYQWIIDNGQWIMATRGKRLEARGKTGRATGGSPVDNDVKIL